MLPLVIGLIGTLVVVGMAATRDPMGVGLLLSSDVDSVADARLEEDHLAMPYLYALSALPAGIGAVLSFPEAPVAARWLFGVFATLFVLLTVGDLRLRRGTLAIYIRLRRREIGFEPKGDVIEVPKLVFLVMSQPAPFVWLLTALALGAGGVALLPYEHWPAMIPLGALAIAIFWLWLRERRDPWEKLARRLRWVSWRHSDDLVEHLEHALDLDPEVVLVRSAAEAVVARFMTRDS